MANEDKRIIELPASTSILNDDWIAKDSASQDTTRLQLSFLKQLCGGNNFAGEWQSGTTYSKDSYVTHEGKLYHNIKGGSVVAVDWSSSQWEQVSIGNELRKIVESLAPTFDTSTNYSVDDLVIYDNTLYRCIAAHTAGTWVGSHFGTVKVSSLLLYFIMDNFTEIYWENYSGSPVNYTKGTVIHKGFNLYRCKADTTNQSWDSSKWEQVDVTDLLATEHGYIQSLFSIIAPTFSTSTSYNVDDFVIYNNQLYMCIYPHNGAWNSGHFLLSTVSNPLQALYSNLADTYSFSGAYVKGDVVNYAGVLWRCIVDTATSPMVFSEWEQVTVEQLIDEKVADVQIAGQTTTDEDKISDLTSLAIEGTASGEIASFSDGSNLPMRSFICNIDAVQDLHGYDAPWVGGAGKNKFDGETKNGYIYNGTYYQSNDYWCNKNDIPVKPNTTYIFSSLVSNGQICCYDANKQYTGDKFSPSASFTTPANCAYISIYNPIATISNNIQLEEGSTATTFAPYSNICPISGHTGVDAVISPTTEASAGTTYSVSWQTEAGEVYGGYVDLVSGELTVTRVINRLQNVDYSQEKTGFIRVAKTISNAIISNNKYDISNCFTFDYVGVIGFNGNPSKPYTFCASTNKIYAVLPYGSEDTLATINTWLDNNPTYICTTLATPQTYQLTPTQIKSLLGSNNAWCDTGDVNVKYNKDATIVINSLIARIEALENA